VSNRPDAQRSDAASAAVSAIGIPAHIDAAKLDAAGHVATDTPCDQCGYNLRTLHLTARCPECHHPVERSATCDLLRYAPPEYTRGLLLGTDQLLLGLLLVDAAGLMLLASLGADLPSRYDDLGTVLTAFAATFIITSIMLIPHAVGRITRPDPRRRHHATANRLCRALRITLVVFVVALAGCIVVEVPLPGWFWLQRNMLVLAVSGTTAGLAGLGLLPALTLRFLAHLARRLAAPQTADALLLLSVLVVVAAVITTLSIYLEWPPAIGGIITGAALVACTAAVLVLRTQLARASRQAAHHQQHPLLCERTQGPTP
jgi:hypothetical protein